MDVSLRYDLRRSPHSVPRDELYATCLDQCAWADKQGFDIIRLHEHHGSPDGYLPSPAVMGAAIAARTSSVQIRFSILLLALHHPLRIAEDIAVLDQISRGRVEVTAAAGYVAQEFAMFGENVEDRLALLEEKIGILRQAWSGEPFDFHGVEVQVQPRPYRDRMIPIVMGGSSPLAARIAARIADGFEPSTAKFKPAYIEECTRLGKKPGWLAGPNHELTLLHVSEDPDRTWARLGKFAEHETNQYASLGATARLFKPVEDIDELRAPGKYTIATPDEAFEILRDLGPDAEVTFSPLMGGMDPDLSWESLELLAGKVFPRLQEIGVR